MSVLTRTLTYQSKGNSELIDITADVEKLIASGNIEEGIVFVPGSTASVTTIEFEPGLAKDLPRAMERVAPSDARYDHDLRWGDGNGMSHVRASIVGPGIVVPFTGRTMMLGTWQQIVIVDFDVKPRQRNVIVQIMGD
jgi:secondary thiamine-phosphate synthase enzyme